MLSLFTLITSNGLLDPNAFDTNATILFGIKTMFVVAGILYTMFAVLVVRQINIMSTTVSSTASPLIKLLGYVHLVFALIALIYYFIVL